MSKSPYQKYAPQSRNWQSQSDYAPLQGPPNPKVEQARAAMREYMRPMLVAEPVEVSPEREHVDDELAQLRATAALIWPDIAHYISAATIGECCAIGPDGVNDWHAARLQFEVKGRGQ